MNHHPVPSLDACLSELLREEQRIVTQATMEHRANKFCNYYKKQGHIIFACPIRPERKQGTAYHASTGASSSTALPAASSVVPILAPTALANPNTLTPEMVQQMIISTFGLSVALLGFTFSGLRLKFFQSFKRFLALIKTQFYANIKVLCSDSGGEYMSNEFQEFLQSKGIISQRSCPSTPQQNGVAERKNRHLLDVVRTLLLDSSVPPRFWCEALSTAIHLINCLPSPMLNHVSPFSKLFGHSPLYSDLRTFGCVCFVHLPTHERHKLTAQSIKCAFLGYAIPHKGYVCYDPLARRIRVSRNVIFFENQYFFPSHVELPSAFVSLLPSFSESLTIVEGFKPGFGYERCSRHESNSTSSVAPSNLDSAPDPAPTSTTLRRSTRLSQPPDWYGFFSPVSLVATLSSISIPSCYKQAMEHECWQNAMQAELQALEENHTWDIVPCPPTVKPIGSKWVFSVKLCFDGSLDRYKARIVALGNKQEYGVDYEETFAPTTKMTTVRTILAIAASQSWQLHQMDVKNASLHGDLQEEIYMKLPSGMTNSFPHDVSLPKVNMIIPSSSTRLRWLLHTTFHMKDFGQLTYFLGLEVHHRASGIFVNQHRYIQDLITLAGLEDTSSVDTPMEVNVKYRKDEGDLLDDPTLYRCLVGSLIYLTTTRPNISYAVHQTSQFMTSPRHLHLAAV
ncbi:Retrovirus-related Pol polyprotein from transposon TNT 1-94 [Vitis vinifera]|uniref:Retrovirus-related Pol polyprotein from transposon TNT 1-94 n=1 Tax=Vitis vinifera TaxID=29760 RepID=A0A438HBW3_VITVI|nr:Retrovirus-related Pol polyprotein from transposon TNT 1-94 [Vitis vinifera]